MQSHDQRVALEEDARQPDSETLCSFLELLAAFLPTTGTRVIAIEAVSAVAWFLAVMWLNFTGGAEVNFALAMGSGVFVAILTLLLVISSVAIESFVALNGSRWRGRSEAVPAFSGSAPRHLRDYAWRSVVRPSCLLGALSAEHEVQRLPLGK